MDITELLAFSVQHKASDLHLSSGVSPMIRVDGDVRRINIPALADKDVNSLVYDIMNDNQRKDYEQNLEVDFSFEVPNLARFRVNAFNSNRGPAAVFRTIPSDVLTLEDLGAPDIFKTISDIFFPLIADKIFGEFCDFNPLTQAFKTLCGLADPRDFATTSCMPKTSHTDLIAPPAMIPVPTGADLINTFPDPFLPFTS